VSVAAPVGNEALRLGNPRGFAADTTEFVVVTMVFGDEEAALEAMLLKKES